MNTKELRIGNWMYCKGEYGEIEAIAPRELTIYVKERRKHISPYEVSPIPITEEILLKCGFVKRDHRFTLGVLKESSHYTYKIELFKNEFGIFYDHKNEGSYLLIISLHQLQNLFFALTGEELNIEL